MSWKKEVARDRGMIVDRHTKQIRLKDLGDIFDHKKEVRQRRIKRKERKKQR
jgi:hypothetical protein